MKSGIAVTVFCMIMLLACGEDSPSEPVGWNNGSWTGETSFSNSVTFTLSHPEVSDWTVTVEYEYADTTDVRTWISSTIYIADDSSFIWCDSIDNDTLLYVFSLNGNFFSGDSAGGTWDTSVDYNLSGGHSGNEEVGGNWSATGPN